MPEQERSRPACQRDGQSEAPQPLTQFYERSDSNPRKSSGVPAALVTADDFVQVRLPLVAYLGGLVEAFVFERIRWRTQAESRMWVEHAGRRWWSVSIPKLADELGCSEKVIRRAVDALTASGALDRIRLNLDGPYDRRWAYSPVITDLPYRADQYAPQGGCTSAPQGGSSSIEDLEDSSGRHKFHSNAERALTALVAERKLPLAVADLLPVAYRLGGGDPWRGYLEIKLRTTDAIVGARNPGAVLKARLEAAP